MISNEINSKIFVIDKYKGQEYNLENESGIDMSDISLCLKIYN